MKIMYCVNQMEAAIEFVLSNNKCVKSQGWTRDKIREDIFRWFDLGLRDKDVTSTGSMGIIVNFSYEVEYLIVDINVDPNLSKSPRYVYYEAE